MQTIIEHSVWAVGSQHYKSSGCITWLIKLSPPPPYSQSYTLWAFHHTYMESYYLLSVQIYLHSCNVINIFSMIPFEYRCIHIFTHAEFYTLHWYKLSSACVDIHRSLPCLFSTQRIHSKALESMLWQLLCHLHLIQSNSQTNVKSITADTI